MTVCHCYIFFICIRYITLSTFFPKCILSLLPRCNMLNRWCKSDCRIETFFNIWASLLQNKGFYHNLFLPYLSFNFWLDNVDIFILLFIIWLSNVQLTFYICLIPKKCRTLQMAPRLSFIDDINPQSRNWTMKVQVLEKSYPRNSSSNPTRYQRLILGDVKVYKLLSSSCTWKCLYLNYFQQLT